MALTQVAKTVECMVELKDGKKAEHWVVMMVVKKAVNWVGLRESWKVVAMVEWMAVQWVVSLVVVKAWEKVDKLEVWLDEEWVDWKERSMDFEGVE